MTEKLVTRKRLLWAILGVVLALLLFERLHHPIIALVPAGASAQMACTPEGCKSGPPPDWARPGDSR